MGAVRANIIPPWRTHSAMLNALLGKRSRAGSDLEHDDYREVNFSDTEAEAGAHLGAIQRSIIRLGTPASFATPNAATPHLRARGIASVEEQAMQCSRQALLLLGLSAAAIQFMEF